MNDIVYYVIVGFIAQMINGTVGIAYGVNASSFLLARGVTPIIISATIQVAKVFTTGISGLLHHYFDNVD